ncbi:anhydro-N-acetylmuramic acid kinase [Alphaproteobacteria bacterium]|nr:anhydro-N-acetylmuramic acid kinase [Alphaproteobacteria bacterium]
MDSINPKKINISLKQELNYFVTIDHAKCVESILKRITVKPRLIGFHGQTIYHDPQKKKSYQAGDGKLLSHLLQIPVVSNFRDNDISNGGQGAPIAPIYHKYLIQKLKISLPACFLNIGGICNITYWDGKELIGFDTGPGNALMDIFSQKRLSLKYDKDGLIASSGTSNLNKIQKILKHDFFNKKYPKSLDKNEFNFFIDFIAKNEKSHKNILATLNELTAYSVQSGLEILPKKPKSLTLMGGGSKNLQLVKNFKKIVQTKIYMAEDFGLDSEMIEAELIAFLAARSYYGLPITYPNTTGVPKPISTGKIYK